MAALPPSIGAGGAVVPTAVGGEARARTSIGAGGTGGEQAGGAKGAVPTPATVVDRRGVVAGLVRFEVDPTLIAIRPGSGVAGEARLIPVLPGTAPTKPEQPSLASHTPVESGAAPAKAGMLARAMEILAPERVQTRGTPATPPTISQPTERATLVDRRDGQLVLRSPTALMVAVAPAVELPTGAEIEVAWIGPRQAVPEDDAALQSAIRLALPSRPSGRPAPGASLDASPTSVDAEDAPQSGAMPRQGSSSSPVSTPVGPSGATAAALASELPASLGSLGKIASPGSAAVQGQTAPAIPGPLGSASQPSGPSAPTSPTPDRAGVSAPSTAAPPIVPASLNTIPSALEQPVGPSPAVPSAATPVSASPVTAMVQGEVELGASAPSATMPVAAPLSAGADPDGPVVSVPAPPSNTTMPAPSSGNVSFAVSSPTLASGVPSSPTTAPLVLVAPVASTLSVSASTIGVANVSSTNAGTVPLVAAPTGSSTPHLAAGHGRGLDEAGLGSGGIGATPRPSTASPLPPSTLPALARLAMAAYGQAPGSRPITAAAPSPAPSMTSVVPPAAETTDIALGKPGHGAEPVGATGRASPSVGPSLAQSSETHETAAEHPVGRSSGASGASGATAAGPLAEPRAASPELSALGTVLGRLMEGLGGKVMPIDGEEDGRARRRMDEPPDRLALELELEHVGPVRLELAWSRAEVTLRLIGRLSLDGAERAALLRDVGRAIEAIGVRGRLLVLDEDR